MSESLRRNRWRTINATPFHDLLRGRVTGRLDWRGRLASAGLPADVASLVTRVVRRTRLWRLEKAVVADELIAHFADAMAAGVLPADAAKEFGDERAAAKLIRRAKRRGRPLASRAWTWAWRGTGILALIYGGLMARFATGRSSVSVDYVAMANGPTLAVPADDRAWPLWRQVMLQLTEWRAHDYRSLPALFDRKPTDGPDRWPSQAEWLRQHAGGLALARRAAAKRAFGFVVGPGGSESDPTLFATYNDQPGDPLNQIILPYMTFVRDVATALSADARLAGEQGDGDRAEADLTAIVRLADQVRGRGGFVIDEMVAMGVDRRAVDRLGALLVHRPAVLSDAALVRLAHAMSRAAVAGDLIDLTGERRFFADLVQRTYTDDGHGDGRITPAGLALIPQFLGPNGPPGPGAPAALLPFAVASRADVVARYNQLMDASVGRLAKPMRDVDWRAFDKQIGAWWRSPVERLHYLPSLCSIPGLGALQAQAERYLGHRDGLLVGIALELYHRSHGGYPATLTEMTPDFLPDVSADRITGDLVRYRLVDGKPVVYSVGADRVDDGGRPALDSLHRTGADGAADWNVNATDAPRGDWVLYPPEGDER